MKVTLKAARVNAGLRQTDAAGRMGCSVDHIKWLENAGAATIKVGELKRLCEIYGCTIDDIFLPDNFTESEVKK